MKLLSAIMLLMFIGSPNASDSPEDAATKFYSTILADRYHGCLPEENQLKRLSPFTSKRLSGLLRDALAYREKFIKDHPAAPPIIIKPPFSDGDCFSSVAEGAKSFTLGKSQKTAAGFRLELRLTYFDATRPEEKPFEWTDAIIVIKEYDRFVVDDMEFLGTWPYGNHGTLSKNLKYRE
jgi:hypothetical protein